MAKKGGGSKKGGGNPYRDARGRFASGPGGGGKKGSKSAGGVKKAKATKKKAYTPPALTSGKPSDPKAVRSLAAKKAAAAKKAKLNEFKTKRIKGELARRGVSVDGKRVLPGLRNNHYQLDRTTGKQYSVNTVKNPRRGKAQAAKQQASAKAATAKAKRKLAARKGAATRKAKKDATKAANPSKLTRAIDGLTKKIDAKTNDIKAKRKAAAAKKGAATKKAGKEARAAKAATANKVAAKRQANRPPKSKFSARVKRLSAAQQVIRKAKRDPEINAAIKNHFMGTTGNKAYKTGMEKLKKLTGQTKPRKAVDAFISGSLASRDKTAAGRLPKSFVKKIRERRKINATKNNITPFNRSNR